MNKNEILQQLIEENNGYLLSSKVKEKNISKTFLAKYVKENDLERVARGIYITEDVWPDELYIMQVRNAAVIFSGETALYLHGLIDREYSEICVSVPTGYNATHLKTGNVQVKYASKKRYGLGVCTVPSTSGNMVRVYDRERCICDLVSDRNKIEVQNFQTAMKEYMLGKGKKLSRLIEYAEKLGMRDEVMKYVEVFG
ncbi:MAG: abortive phage infection protein [Lachnospiraceae bacterium]|nr:abortive phage infection protein [Lachnospiraceae bacterium]